MSLAWEMWSLIWEIIELRYESTPCSKKAKMKGRRIEASPSYIQVNSIFKLKLDTGILEHLFRFGADGQGSERRERRGCYHLRRQRKLVLEIWLIERPLDRESFLSSSVAIFGSWIHSHSCRYNLDLDTGTLEHSRRRLCMDGHGSRSGGECEDPWVLGNNSTTGLDKIALYSGDETRAWSWRFVSGVKSFQRPVDRPGLRFATLDYLSRRWKWAISSISGSY